MEIQYALLGWPPDGPTLRLDHRRFAYAGKFVLPDTGKAVAWPAETVATGRRPPDEVPRPPSTGPTGDGAAATTADGGAVADAGAEAGDGDGDVDVPAGDEPYADVLGAAAFSPDRTDPSTLRVRYVTTRADRRGEGIGARLLRFVVAAAGDAEYDRVLIAVNNPFAFEAAARAGFVWTGVRTGLAELVCAAPAGSDGTAADAGLDPEVDPAERYRAGLDAFRERADGDPEASFLASRGRTPPSTVTAPAGTVARPAGVDAGGRGDADGDAGDGRAGGADATDATDGPDDDASGFGAGGFGAGGHGGTDAVDRGCGDDESVGAGRAPDGGPDDV